MGQLYHVVLRRLLSKALDYIPLILVMRIRIVMTMVHATASPAAQNELVQNLNFFLIEDDPIF